MRTVKEVSELSGVTVRALHHYDSIGLLPATEVTAAGYRLYDDKALERLQMILLFRELKFPLAEIKTILDGPGFDRTRALKQQIRLLELQRERLGELIDLARSIQPTGVKHMSKQSFEAFDTKKIDEYAAEAKKTWGKTAAWSEFERKSEGRTKEEELSLADRLIAVFGEFGAIRESDPASPEVRALVVKLQAFITENYYTCTDRILAGLGQMYAGGGEMTENIDRCAGEGTGAFANAAIAAYLASK
ncbi:MAG: MerR family transcriptional regulator [Clostridia bacterium]|nr:MerR family transcriptional regulator [Clostridia bacterium]